MARSGLDSREKSLEAFVNVWKPWLDEFGAQHVTAKDYADTRHAGVLFGSPLGASAADCNHDRALRMVLSLILVLFSVATESLAQTPSGPVNISGQSGTIVDGLHITNPNGDCVTIANSTNITVRNSEIGPCGGHGINISGGGTINIYDSYIHPGTPLSTSCCDTHDGIFGNGTTGLSIQGNVIAYGEANIEVNNVSNVSVIGNFLLNPINSDPSQPAPNQSRGQNFQVYYGSSNVTVQNNYALSSLDTTKYLFPENQEDSINFGFTNGIIASGNYVTGGHSNSGCGIITDDGANNAQFKLNVLVDTGQCGIGIADGTNQVVDSNKILNTTPVSGGGNTAIYVALYGSTPCGPVQVSNNIASGVDTSGNQNSYYDGGGCAPVTLTNNVFDAAAATLLQPVSTNLPPPLIPPQPHACVVVSPYTNNTSLSRCSGSSTAPAPPTQLAVIVH
jgi:Right handed beta helix region